MELREKAIDYFKDCSNTMKNHSDGSRSILTYYELAIRALESERECEKCEVSELDNVMNMPSFSRAMDTVDQAYRLIIEDMKETGGKNAWKFFPTNWAKSEYPHDKPPFDTIA